MKRLWSVAALPLLLVGCSSTDSQPAPTTVTVTSSSAESSATTTPSASESTTSAAPETVQTSSSVEQAAPVAQQEPYVVECLEGVPGPARWSDGTMRHSQWCWETRGGAEYAEAESNAGLPNPATIPYADGGTCPAAICGYGHDEYGNRNPSSGEIQAKDGCDKGYITDPELCAAVAHIKVP